MKIILLTLIPILFLSLLSFSQSDQCNCANNLATLIAKTQENYAGYPVKVNSKTSLGYKTMIKALQAKTAAIQEPKACFYLLKEYIRFFKDKHFLLSYSNAKDYDQETMVYYPEYFSSRISNNKLAGVEGLWINADTSLTLAIQKISDKTYNGMVIKSRDDKFPVGLVYFKLITTRKGFMAKEFNSFMTTYIPAKQKGNLLQIWNHAMFGKIYPTMLDEGEQAELGTWRNNNDGLSFKKISAKTAYLKVPSFFNNDDKIRQLVAMNDSIIKTCDNLIVDITGNGGGSTGWVSFLPYFMTNRVIQYDTYLRVTPENVKAKLTDLEPFATKPIPEEYKKYFPGEIVAAYKKAYQELPGTQKKYYPIPAVSFPLDSIIAKPKKIALVVDDLCGSSAEYFFFLSKQSSKTTTYGINTLGMMDYEGMSTPTPMPYDKFILTIPIVQSSWTDTNPIDQTGFKPDKMLSHINPKDWIDMIQKDLEQK